MSYSDSAGPMLLPCTSGTVAVQLATAAAVIAQFLVLKPCALRRISFTTVVAITVTDAIITVKKYPSALVSTSASTISTLTIPVSGSAIGRVIYKDITPFLLVEGDGLVFEVTTTATAGQGLCSFVVDEDPETAFNNAEMIASA